MLQRRKKYKNRMILGYKTLAAGHIDMSQVGHLRTSLAVYKEHCCVELFRVVLFYFIHFANLNQATVAHNT